MAKRKKQLDPKLVLASDGLEYNDPPTLVWVRVRDAAGLLWEGNPKLHDLGSVIESVSRHGFQEIPKFDAYLPNISGKMGAFKAGNGRIEALALMEEDGTRDLPRGLAREKDGGSWVLPLLVGTDARSQEAARSYAIDSNNLTLGGGSFSVEEVARMWDPSYADMVLGLINAGEVPVSVDEDALEMMKGLMGEGDGLSSPKEFPEYDDDIGIDFTCPKCGYQWSGSAS